jgi:peptidoglycan glycosyltransferase
MKKRNQLTIYVSMGAFLTLFLSMIIYLCVFVAQNETVLINNNYNSRQETLLSRNYRGTIYSADGDVLAFTEVAEDQSEKRVYPYGDVFAHIVGYSTKGRMGVESLANYYLINSDIPVSSKVSNDMAGVKNPGNNVYTTLDVELQTIADEYLNVYRGAVIVTDVKTGRILAMLSHPDFDPGDIDKDWEKLVNDKDSSVLVNRATQGLYPPGSTFKILTALEYYRENKNSWEDYSYECNGSFKFDGFKINCYHGKTHGTVDLKKSFAKSCNSSFANIGMTLDRDSFADTLMGLLFLKELPTDLLTSESQVIINDEMTDYDMMQTSIGQGKTTMTPLHLNMITMAIANEGILMKPYVLDHVENAEGEVIKSFSEESAGRYLTKQESEFLTQLMIDVVEEGTGTKLSGLDYTAAGKTGSAEYNDVKGDSHAWFTGFAPAEDPEIAVTIIIEGAGSGGDYAVPLAKRLFDAYFARQSLGK